MASLTETAYYTRRVFLFAGIFLVSFFVLKNSLKLTRQLIRKLKPPPPPAPTVSFGKLPKLLFLEQKDKKEIKYRLETIEGKLPAFEKTGKVYLMPKRTPSFLALDNAKKKALKMGFKNEPEQIIESVYIWREEGSFPRTLEMDILADKFKISYPYQLDQSILTEKYLPNLQQAASEALGFLRTQGFLENDLANGRQELTYWRFTPQQLIPGLSLSEADFIRLDIFRSDLDNLRVLPSYPQRPPVSFLFSGSRQANKRMIEIKFGYYPIEKEIWGTYPLRSIQSAWEQLQKNEGYIANYGEIENSEVIIRKVYVAYYDSETPQNYLQPIYVFEGDKNFFAYITAIDPKWLE